MKNQIIQTGRKTVKLSEVPLQFNDTRTFNAVHFDFYGVFENSFLQYYWFHSLTDNYDDCRIEAQAGGSVTNAIGLIAECISHLRSSLEVINALETL